MLFFLVLLVNFSRVVRKDYSHDEDQFVTSAWLTAQHGMLPYRDYAYFHAPYLVFIYAAVLRLAGDTPLFSTRLFSSLCGSASIFLVFYLVLDFFRFRSQSGGSGRSQPGWIGYLAATCILLLYLMNPITAAAAGLSWNHDVMLLFLLLGFAAAYWAQGRTHAGRWLFLSGMLLALAVGVRSTAVTVLPVYLLAVWFFPARRSFKSRLHTSLTWSSGFLLGLLPMLVLFLLAPRQFIFGNFEYAGLNTRYRVEEPVINGDINELDPSSLEAKLEYVIERGIQQPSVLLLLFLLAVFGWTALPLAWRQGQVSIFLFLLLILLPPFALVGSFLPSPVWIQYFYAPVPFILLAVAMGAAGITAREPHNPGWVVIVLWVVVFSLVFDFKDLRRAGFVRYPELWRPLMVHQVGQQMRQLVSEDGRVFTLSPLYLLEGGLDIDPNFVTGTFAYRTGNLLTKQERQLYHIISEDELSDYLDAQPPDAIFLGLDPLLDERIKAYALKNGYQERQLTSRLSLWVRDG